MNLFDRWQPLIEAFVSPPPKLILDCCRVCLRQDWYDKVVSLRLCSTCEKENKKMRKLKPRTQRRPIG